MPSPPINASLPRPPSSVSLPAPPLSVSSPAPPVRVSLFWPPVRLIRLAALTAPALTAKDAFAPLTATLALVDPKPLKSPLVTVTVTALAVVNALPSTLNCSIPLTFAFEPSVSALLDVPKRKFNVSEPPPPSIVSVLASSPTLMMSLPSSAVIESEPVSAKIKSLLTVPVRVSLPAVPITPTSRNSTVGAAMLPPRYKLPQR